MKTRYILLSISLLLFPFISSAAIKTEEVTYTLNGVQLHSYVAYDDALEGKLPVVLVVHEWWGCNDYIKGRAKDIAGLGYFAIAVDMYGDHKLAETPQQAMEFSGVLYNDAGLALERLNAAVDFIRKYPSADTSKVSAIGYCFGGSMVLNAAKMGMDLQTAVSFHGGLQGVPAEAGKTKANILVCHGGADPFVPEADVDAFRKNMDEMKVNYTFRIYEGATHAFTNPYSTETGKKFNLPIAYNEAADKASWEDMKAFFKAHIR